MAPGTASLVRALLVVPRIPGTGHTGDRLRAELHLAALRQGGFDVVLVGGVPPTATGVSISGVEVRPVRLGPAGIPAAVAAALIAGRPLQSGLFAGDWKSALSGAGLVDLAVVVLPVRLLPHLGEFLPRAPLVVDFVDALGEAARQAARDDPALWRRAYWRLEGPRLARLEREAGARGAALIATTSFDAAHLPAGTRPVPNGVAIGPEPPRGRGAVVAFSGRLGYRPNYLAVRRLAEEIWPLVRRAVPEAMLTVGGADAPAGILGFHGRGGVVVESPVLDMGAFLRRARAVAIPVDLGTGTPNKLFEAFEAGAAVVASGEAVSRATLDGGAPPAVVACSNEEFAEALVLWLRDPARAESDGARGRAWVERNADRRRSVETLLAGYRAAMEKG